MIKNVLIIGHVWPEPKSSAAGSRMLQLMEILQCQKHKVLFATACAPSDNAFDLASIGIETKEIKLNDVSFDDFVKEFNPGIVLFDRFMTEEQFGWRVAENCPNALRILDTEDLHCLRKGRQQAFKDGVAFDDTYLFNDTAKREIASIYRCDLSLIISEVEMNILQQKFKVDTSLLLYLPFLLDDIQKEQIQELPSFEQRNHFITIGNFLHEPNFNAVLSLKEAIWPLIRKQLPKSELRIYGAYASQKVTQLHSEKDGFFIKGFASDVHTVMSQAKVCLAPLRFGAGLKGKVLDAMQNGTPCVMTSIASEGLFTDLQPNGFVENNYDNFANKAVELYTDEAVWMTKQKNGFEALNHRFNKNYFEASFMLRLNSIMNQLKTHRLQNFTGHMLQHHAMQSTKFMSKWIEAKNK